MKVLNQRLAWAIFLLLAGAFLLLKNLRVFGAWGEAVWGGVFAVVGAGFLGWLVFDRQRWWRAIAGFPLLGIGALILLKWRGIDLGTWDAALVMVAVALGFWAVLLVHSENWWAVIPAGILTVLGVLTGLRNQVSDISWLAAFFLGLGLVFVLLYAIRFGQRDTRWAAIPGAALILLGVATLADSLSAVGPLLKWWPILLLVGGLGLLVGSLGRRAAVVAVPVKPDYSAIPPSPGAAVIEALPEARPDGATTASAANGTVVLPPQPASASEQPKPVPGQTAESPVDIYALLDQQPKQGEK